MLLLTLSSLLLFFITYYIGKTILCGSQKWLKISLQIDFLGIFLLGLVTCYIYFNIFSFVIPVNYKLLVIPLIISIIQFTKGENIAGLFKGINNTASLLFTRGNLLITIPFLLIFFLFWVMPPGNADSGAYHYLSISWYEKYRVVPGLANLHSRLAYNPASFIISAAYSFTDITNQSLYPLNGVINLLYLTWLLRMVFRQTSSLLKTIFLFYAVLELRDTLMNISSPSPDLLMAVLVSYCGINTYQLIKSKNISINTTWILIILTSFSACAKLTVVSTLLLIPFLWILTVKNHQQILFKTIAVLLLLYVPWLFRNAIMSGYFLYPINGTNFINFDWTVPKEVLQLDHFYTKYGSRGLLNVYELAAMGFPKLFSTWVDQGIHYNLLSFTVTVLSFVTPIFAILYIRIKKVVINSQIILLGSIYYVAALAWLLYSPEYRFGLCILQLILVFSLLELNCHISIRPVWLRLAESLLLLIMVVHFIKDFFVRPTNHDMHLISHLVLPAKDMRYEVDSNNKKTFPFIILNNDVRLYLSDSNHEYLNSDFPCMSWRYGQIEMRGATLQQGFRIIKNEVKKTILGYPNHNFYLLNDNPVFVIDY